MSKKIVLCTLPFGAYQFYIGELYNWHTPLKCGPDKMGMRTVGRVGLARRTEHRSCKCSLNRVRIQRCAAGSWHPVIDKVCLVWQGFHPLKIFYARWILSLINVMPCRHTRISYLAIHVRFQCEGRGFESMEGMENRSRHGFFKYPSDPESDF